MKLSKAKIYRNYASGLLFGGLGIGIWAIYHNIYDSDPYVWWSNALTIPNLPTTFISNNLLILISFFCLGGSIVFISNTVERDIQQKRHPYFTELLILMEFLLLGFGGLLKVSSSQIIQVGFPIAFFGWIGVIVINFLNLIFTYGKAISQSSGMVSP